jgi:hypothetical protein
VSIGATQRTFILTAAAGVGGRVDKYLRIQERMQKLAHQKPHSTMWFDSLVQCALRTGNGAWGRFSIDKVLGYALATPCQNRRESAHESGARHDAAETP